MQKYEGHDYSLLQYGSKSIQITCKNVPSDVLFTARQSSLADDPRWIEPFYQGEYTSGQPAKLKQNNSDVTSLYAFFFLWARILHTMKYDWHTKLSVFC